MHTVDRIFMLGGAPDSLLLNRRHPAQMRPPLPATRPAAAVAGRALLCATTLLVMQCLSRLSCTAGQGFPVGPVIPSDFVALWLYTHPSSNFSVPQTGTLGLQGGAAYAWRIDTHFPYVNRSEVFTQFENGTEVKGSFWVEADAGDVETTAPSSSTSRRRSLLAAALGFGASAGGVLRERDEGGQAALGNASVFACAPDVTQLGVRGFYLDWTTEEDVELIGVEVVRGIKCEHWHLISPSDNCLDLWTTGSGRAWQAEGAGGASSGGSWARRFE